MNLICFDVCHKIYREFSQNYYVQSICIARIGSYLSFLYQSDFLANLSKDIDANSELRMVTDY